MKYSLSLLLVHCIMTIYRVVLKRAKNRKQLNCIDVDNFRTKFTYTAIVYFQSMEYLVELIRSWYNRGNTEIWLKYYRTCCLAWIIKETRYTIKFVDEFNRFILEFKKRMFFWTNFTNKRKRKHNAIPSYHAIFPRKIHPIHWTTNRIVRIFHQLEIMQSTADWRLQITWFSIKLL